MKRQQQQADVSLSIGVDFVIRSTLQDHDVLCCTTDVNSLDHAHGPDYSIMFNICRLQGGSVEQHAVILERQQGCTALAGLLSFCETLADSSSHNRWDLSLYDTKRYMRLVSHFMMPLHDNGIMMFFQGYQVLHQICFTCMYSSY